MRPIPARQIFDEFLFSLAFRAGARVKRFLIRWRNDSALTASLAGVVFVPQRISIVLTIERRRQVYDRR